MLNRIRFWLVGLLIALGLSAPLIATVGTPHVAAHGTPKGAEFITGCYWPLQTVTSGGGYKDVQWENKNFASGVTSTVTGSCSKGANPEKFSMGEGLWLISATVEWDSADTDGGRYISIWDSNEAYVVAAQMFKATPSGNTRTNVTGIVNIPVSDTFEIKVWQDSGSTLDLDWSKLQIARIDDSI